MVLATTSRPETIDSALLRPGRIEYHLLVPPPPLASRRELLRRALAKMPLSPELRAPSSHEPDPSLLDEFARTSGKPVIVGLFYVLTPEDFSVSFFFDADTRADLRGLFTCGLARRLPRSRQACVCGERERERERRERERERGSITACAFPSLFVALFLA